MTTVASNEALACPSSMNLDAAGLAAHDEVGGRLGQVDNSLVAGDPEARPLHACSDSYVPTRIQNRRWPQDHGCDDVNPLVEVTGDRQMRNLNREPVDRPGKKNTP